MNVVFVVGHNSAKTSLSCIIAGVLVVGSCAGNSGSLSVCSNCASRFIRQRSFGWDATSAAYAKPALSLQLTSVCNQNARKSSNGLWIFTETVWFDEITCVLCFKQFTVVRNYLPALLHTVQNERVLVTAEFNTTVSTPGADCVLLPVCWRAR